MKGKKIIYQGKSAKIKEFTHNASRDDLPIETQLYNYFGDKPFNILDIKPTGTDRVLTVFVIFTELQQELFDNEIESERI